MIMSLSLSFLMTNWGLIVFESSLTLLVRFTDRIRIRNPQSFKYRVKIMFVICCLPLSFCCFNITNEIAWFSLPAQLLDNTTARVIQAGGINIQRYELLRYDDYWIFKEYWLLYILNYQIHHPGYLNRRSKNQRGQGMILTYMRLPTALT